MISDSKIGIVERDSLLIEESKKIKQGFKPSNQENDEMFETPKKEMVENCSTSLSPILLNLEEIQAKFWKEFNEIPRKENTESVNGFLTEREVTVKPRQKRKYVRKAKLMEEMLDDEFEVKHKTFVVDGNSTLVQLIDEAIVDSRKQTKRMQIKEELKNKNNQLSDDTESVCSFSNFKSDYSDSNSETKQNRSNYGLSKKSVNMKNCMWETQELDKFYNLLEFLGTDFSLISSLLKTKTISQIKKKYHHELKKNPKRINEALNKESFKVNAINYQYLIGMTKVDENQIPDEFDICNSQRIQFRQRTLQTVQVIIFLHFFNNFYKQLNCQYFSFNILDDEGCHHKDFVNKLGLQEQKLGIVLQFYRLKYEYCSHLYCQFIYQLLLFLSYINSLNTFYNQFSFYLIALNADKGLLKLINNRELSINRLVNLTVNFELNQLKDLVHLTIPCSFFKDFRIVLLAILVQLCLQRNIEFYYFEFCGEIY